MPEELTITPWVVGEPDATVSITPADEGDSPRPAGS